MEEMKAGDFSRVERDTIAQVEAGAHMLDVNAGIPLADEPAILAKTIQLVQSLTDLPLSIDSSIVEALEAGLAVYQGKALVNSVTGEDERLERVLPLVKKYGAAVVAISNDETGISEDPDVRFAVAKRIVERAARPRHPPRGHRRRPAADADRGDADGRPAGLPASWAGCATSSKRQLDLRRVERELRAAAPRGDQRRLPRDGDRERPHARRSRTRSRRVSATAVMAADVLLGNDQDAARWIRTHRVAPPDGEAGGRRTNRRRAGAAARRLTRPMATSTVGPRPGATPSRSSSSRPRAGAAGSRPGRRSSTRPGRSASTSTRSAAGAGSAAAARSSRASAASRSTGSSRSRAT